MRRREFLRGAVGVTALASVGTTAAHPGPYSPLGSIPITNAKEAVPDSNGKFAYVATTDGFAVVDVSVPSDPQMIFEDSNLLGDREIGPLRQIQDVKVDGDRLALPGPANALQGEVLQGFLLYDVSDPTNPEQLAFHETRFPIHNCFIRDGIVYLTGNDEERNPLVVVDVRDGRPKEIARWSLLDLDRRWGEVPSSLRTLHDVWTQDDRAYLSHWDAGTYILDVSDPTNPEFVSRIGGRPLPELVAVPEDEVRAQVIRPPGNAHYAMTNDDGSLLGINKEAWEVEGEGGPGGVQLWDISDVKNPTRLATIDAPPSPDPSIGGTWTTAHNFDIVGDRLFTSWYQGGVKIHDISDPSNPERLAWWRQPENTIFWTAKRATEKFFIASSMGRRADGRGALYTFPTHAGQQKDPPSLTETGNETGGAQQTNGTRTTDATTATPTETTTDATTATETTVNTTQQAAFAGETTTVADSGASGSAPGFGVSSAVAALLGGAALRTFRD